MDDYLSPGNGYGGDGVWRSRRPPIPMPEDPYMDVIKYLELQTPDEEFGNTVCMIDAATGEEMTFRELKHHYRAVAASLSQLGVKQGDIVLLLAPNSIWYPVAFFGVLAAGAICTTVNPVYTPGEIAKQRNDSNPCLIITVTELVCKVQSLGIPLVLIGDGNVSSSLKVHKFSDFLSADPRKAPKITAAQTDTAALLYSSGTTGVSKGAMLSHRNLMASALMLHNDAPIDDRQRTYLCFLPLFHVYGLAVITISLFLRGFKMVVMQKFELKFFLDTVCKYKVTDIPLVPPVVLLLSKCKELDDYDLSHVVEITSGAAPLGKDLMLALLKRLPHVQIRQGFGMTETAGISTVAIWDPRDLKFGSVGPLVSNVEAMIVDLSTYKPLRQGETGEIWLRGPNIMQGYLNKATETGTTIDEGGWLRTGDLGYFDADGFLYIVDRIKELIKYKGFQIAPAELEGLLVTHPQILDAAVVGFPDDQAGEVPIAYVVRSPEGKLTEQEVSDFVGQQVAPFKRLRKVTFIAAIPKSGSGKILRRELTQLGKSKL